MGSFVGIPEIKQIMKMTSQTVPYYNGLDLYYIVMFTFYGPLVEGMMEDDRRRVPGKVGR